MNSSWLEAYYPASACNVAPSCRCWSVSLNMVEYVIYQGFINVSTLFTFSAKEKDTETGYSYFGARYYSSDLGIWLSVDPMAAKYPSLSQYVYCADNPIKLMDPNGEDIIDVDRDSGKTTITRCEGNDILRCGKTSTELSGNGVFRDAQEKGEQLGKDRGTLLVGMSKSDARKTFNFMADNSNVEWGYMETRNDDGSSSFMVGSAHSKETESLVYEKACAVSPGKLIRYDHNHLCNDHSPMAGFPSTPDNAANSNYVDTDAWNSLLKTQPNASFGIRHRGKTTTWVNDKNHGTDNSIIKYVK